MNKSQRILLNTYNKDIDKHIKIKLEQNIKSLEFLSMSIDSNDIYQSFNSDYGVLVGRVIANNSIGIPNAKISIFIPLNDEDSTNPDIYSLYPYTTPRDINNEGKRYNLLPRVGKFVDGVVRPPQPFGSLPIKEEIVTNEEFLNVYKKYYKYTATTNDAGDYMIFGVPTGTQTVHMSVDITDIGKFSMNPASMIKSLGYSENLFINQTIIKPSDDLNDLPHIETQEISVDIIPFWGDTENFEIGITRQDFKIRSVLKNTFTIFGSVFTDGEGSMWGDDQNKGNRTVGELYRAIDNSNDTVSISTKRIGKVTEKIYYYPSDISDEDIENKDSKDLVRLLDKSEYSFYKKDGDFVVIINCNRNKIITDEYGKDINVGYGYNGGIYTSFKGFLTLEITPTDIPMNFSSAFGTNTEILPYRFILKFPQYSDSNKSFNMPTKVNNKNIDSINTINWRKLHYTFNAGKFYSLSKFHGTTYNYDHDSGTMHNGFLDDVEVNKVFNSDPFWNPGIIVTNEIDDNYNNNKYEFPSNSKTNAVPSNINLTVFGGNWLNFSIYLPQLGFVTKNFTTIENIRTQDLFSIQDKYNLDGNGYFNEDNDQEIAIGVNNTKWFARSDLNWTDIIEVPVTDIKTFNDIKTKGFTSNDIEDFLGEDKTYTDNKYRNGINNPSNWEVSPCPYNGGKIYGDPLSSTYDQTTYFYKGINTANCINYLFELGLIK